MDLHANQDILLFPCWMVLTSHLWIHSSSMPGDMKWQNCLWWPTAPSTWFAAPQLPAKAYPTGLFLSTHLCTPKINLLSCLSDDPLRFSETVGSVSSQKFRSKTLFFSVLLCCLLCFSGSAQPHQAKALFFFLPFLLNPLCGLIRMTYLILQTTSSGLHSNH